MTVLQARLVAAFAAPFEPYPADAPVPGEALAPVDPRAARLDGQRAAGLLDAAAAAAAVPGALSSYGVLAHAPLDALWDGGPVVGDQVRVGLHRVGLEISTDSTRVLWTWPELEVLDWAPRDERLVVPGRPAPDPADAAAQAFSVPLPFGTRVLWRTRTGAAAVVRLPLVNPGQVAVASSAHRPTATRPR